MKATKLLSVLMAFALIFSMAIPALADIPPLPTANVKTVTPSADVPLYDTETYNVIGTVDEIESQYTFEPKDVTPEQVAYYGGWYVDYRISFDAAVAAESFGLFGSYSGYGTDFNVAFNFPADLAAGETAVLINAVQPGLVTFNDLMYNVETFACGIYNNSEGNAGKTITVELIMWDPNEGIETAQVVDITTYTFKSNAKYTVELTSQDTSGSDGITMLTGGGEYTVGDDVTITAAEAAGYTFLGWYENAFTADAGPVTTQPSYTFEIEENMRFVAVYEAQGVIGRLHVKGNAYTIDDSVLQESNADFDIEIGQTVTLTYTGSDFLCWVNISNNIVSTSEVYKFTMVDETTIRLVSSIDVEENSSVYVMFMNAYKQILAEGRAIDEFDVEDLFPKTVPSRMGLVFEKWIIEDTGEDATSESIFALASTENTIVKVVPKYEEPEGSYVLVVKYKSGGVVSDLDSEEFEFQIGAGEPKVIKLADIAEAVGLDAAGFSFWSLDGGETASSFEPESYTVVAGDGKTVTLVAVFGEDVEAEPIVKILQMIKKQDGVKNKISTTTRWFVPEGYTVHESGFVYSSDVAYRDNADELIIGAANAKKYLTGMTDPEGIFTLNISVSDISKVFYIKGFITFTDSQSEVVTIYSDMYQGSYNTLAES